MADCKALRPLFQAYLDGEAAPQDRDRIEAHLHTCQNCRDDVSRAAWEVGLFLLNRPTTADAAGPSAGFTDRVMRSVRETPRASTPAAPTAPVRLLPPAPPVARILPWRTWAAAAAFAATAAAVAFVFLNGDPTPDPSQQQLNPEGEGVVVAHNGGALRWTDRDAFDRGLVGSVWIAKDAAVPALPGEYLHSPAPSSVHVRLPGGGQFDAGPSSSLAFSPNFTEDRTVVLLEGALTATAATGAGTLPLKFETPGLQVESSGSLELSVRVDGGPRASVKWFGARSDALEAGTEPPAPPTSTVLVFAREGAALVATSAGPVRNSLERHTLTKGQALVLRKGRVYIQRGVDDDAPPEGTAGLPLPPDSLYFTGTPTLAMSGGTLSGGGAAVMAAGPVRNSLERAISDPTSDPEARADALALYESVGGLEAVEAAAKAVDDPAIQVRCAAVRILALNAWADRPKALAALRRLATDVDSTIAAFSIRALGALEDREAIPMLRTMVVDDDAPPDEVQVAAFATLVRFGDVSRIAEAASRLERLDPQSSLANDLQTKVMEAFQKLTEEKQKDFLFDSRVGVRAAALNTTRNLAAAREGLDSTSQFLQLTAAEVLLAADPDGSLDEFRPLVAGSRGLRNGIILLVSKWSNNSGRTEFPDWLLDTSRQVLEDPASSIEECASAVHLLGPSIPVAEWERILETGTPIQRTAILSQSAPIPSLAVKALGDEENSIRGKAIEQLAAVSVLPETALPTLNLLAALDAFRPATFEEARFKAICYLNLVRRRQSAEGMKSLLSMSTANEPYLRRASAHGLGFLGDRPEAVATLERLLMDPDQAIAEAVVFQIALASRRNRWSGKPIAEQFPIQSPVSVVRAQVAQAARRAGTAGAKEAFARELEDASPQARATILNLAVELDTRLDFVVPSLVRDPSALVRLLLLRATEGNARVEVARALADDPEFWVQSLALSLLASGGDPAALGALQVLVREQKDLPVELDPFLTGLDPESPALTVQIARVAGMVANSWQNSGLMAAFASSYTEALLLKVSRARRCASILTKSASSAERVAATSALGDCQIPMALEILAHHSTPALEQDRAVVEAANTALQRLVGFAPPPSVTEWFRLHRRVYVDKLEIRGASHH